MNESHGIVIMYMQIRPIETYEQDVTANIRSLISRIAVSACIRAASAGGLAVSAHTRATSTYSAVSVHTRFASTRVSPGSHSHCFLSIRRGNVTFHGIDFLLWPVDYWSSFFFVRSLRSPAHPRYGVCSPFLVPGFNVIKLDLEVEYVSSPGVRVPCSAQHDGRKSVVVERKFRANSNRREIIFLCAAMREDARML